jgi:ectoine hydroxylase-related dioxygenase (phytanoyl-CoA dioxygenase family)
MADARTPDASVSIEELLALLGSPDALVQAAPTLHVSASLPARTTAVEAPPEAREESRALAQRGFAAARGAIDGRTALATARAIEALRERSLPASFVYAFDEPWMIGEQIRQQMSHRLGHEYRLVEDVWAWHVPPGHGGWPPHRGVYDVSLDRAAPEILNTWVALSEVPADRACIHVVPIDQDTGYPGTLERVDVPPSAGQALPANPGDVLFWNANVLHWGGECAERATGPRISCSFTLCRADAVVRFPRLQILRPLSELDLTARVDAIARMVTTYGKHQPDVSEAVSQWAALTVALTSRFAATAPHRKAP